MKPFDAFIIRFKGKKQPLIFTLAATIHAAKLALEESRGGQLFDSRIFEIVKLTVAEKEPK